MEAVAGTKPAAHLEQVVHPGADGRLPASAFRCRRSAAVPALRCRRRRHCRMLAAAAADAVQLGLLLSFQQVADAVDQVQQQFMRVLRTSQRQTI